MVSMLRDCLFMAGEFSLTMKLTFRRDRWWHTCSATRLIAESMHVRREKYVNESIRGVIVYADMDDKELAAHNFNSIIESDIPCWPDPRTLLRMNDRHCVMSCIVDAGLIDHDVWQGMHHTRTHHGLTNYPLVLKVGNSHRGHGKYLVSTWEHLHEVEPWDGIATLEPFFSGDSYRVLLVGEDAFGIRVANGQSWIKNSVGADASFDVPCQQIIEHARNVASVFNLDVAGIDYVVNPKYPEDFHFLEVNQFPGIPLDLPGIERVEHFIDSRMAAIESQIK
jgi:hypothetical protein